MELYKITCKYEPLDTPSGYVRKWTMKGNSPVNINGILNIGDIE